MTASTDDLESLIDRRLLISALWTGIMFIFAYVDLFSLYRPDVRADLADDRLFAFQIDQLFLFLVTLYIIVPSVLIYLTLVMRRRISRIVNITAGLTYGVTIAGSAIGEWNYFILGSVVEAILAALIVHHAWTWSGARSPVREL